MKEYKDYVTMLRCVIATLRGKLSDTQIDWLVADRARANYFDACMK